MDRPTPWPRLLTLATALALTVAAALPAPAQDTGPTAVEAVVESFDGTPIVTTLHLPAGASAGAPVPLVLKGHGWGLSGDVAARGPLFEGLLAAGYAVLTWDARGFGESGGEAQVDSLEFEGRDVQALIDWAATDPAILLEGPGDPVLGMTGESYGGGIQLATSAIDPRVDALAPEITWHSLNRALNPNGVLKLAWLEGLFGLGLTTGTLLGAPPTNPAGFQTGSLAPELVESQVQALATNAFDEDFQAFLRDRSLGHYGAQRPVTVPTLLLQGSVDTLFTIDEALDTLAHVAAQGAPAKLVVFCGGLDAAATGGAVTHGVCPGFYEPAGDRARMNDLILRWFDRHLRGQPVDPGPTVEYRTNDGVWHRADALPVATPVTAPVDGSLLSTTLPGNGLGIFANASPPGDPGTVFAEILAADIGPVEIVGTLNIRIDVTGTGMGAHLFVKLVDRESGEVLGEGHALNQQETPFIVGPLSDAPQTIAADLVSIAYTLPEGHHLDLQVASSSGMFTPFRGGPAQVAITGEVSVPVRDLVVDRVAGPDRTGTAAELSRDAHAVPGGSTVVIARADGYADALAGGPLAANLEAPLLLSSGDGLADAAAREVRRTGATQALLLGGTAALGPQVEADLAALGLTVRRVAGEDRFATAALIAAEIGGTAAYVVEGAHADPARGWPDAVVASGIASLQQRPVLLVERDRLPQATADALTGVADVTIVGGEAAVSAATAAAVTASGATVTRAAGPDRYGTAAAVADLALAAGADAATVVLATGRDWPDALAAGPFAARFGGVALLVDGTAGSPATTAWLAAHADDVHRLVIAGGTAAIVDAVVAAATATATG